MRDRCSDGFPRGFAHLADGGQGLWVQLHLHRPVGAVGVQLPRGQRARDAQPLALGVPRAAEEADDLVLVEVRMHVLRGLGLVMMVFD